MRLKIFLSLILCLMLALFVGGVNAATDDGAGDEFSITVPEEGHTCNGIPFDDPSVCSSQGSCDAPDVCTCNEGYEGDACETETGHTCDGIAFDDPSVCSGQGTCDAPDMCTCNEGFEGANCETETGHTCDGIAFDDPSVCSGNGDCVEQDTCVCTDGFEGDDCETESSICGSELTADLTLTEDLECDEEAALVVDENDITIDCDGYAIIYTGEGGIFDLGASEAPDGGIGIELESYEGITIQNCEIYDFQTGIVAIDSSDLLIQNNNLHDNGIMIPDMSGLHMEEVYDSQILNNQINFNDYGIYMIDSENNTFTGNDMKNNSYQALYMENSHDNTFVVEK